MFCLNVLVHVCPCQNVPVHGPVFAIYVAPVSGLFDEQVAARRSQGLRIDFHDNYYSACAPPGERSSGKPPMAKHSLRGATRIQLTRHDAEKSIRTSAQQLFRFATLPPHHATNEPHI